MGYGIFYNPIEQLVLEQFSAEPPFGGSNFISSPLLQTPYVDQSGDVFPNPFNGILNPPRGQADRLVAVPPDDVLRRISAEFADAVFRSVQPDDQAPVARRNSLPGRLRRLARPSFAGQLRNQAGNPTTCNQLNTILGDGTCGPFGEDSAYTIPAGTVIPAGGFQLPYNAGSGGLTVPAGALANPITLVGIRQFSSPLCQPLTGVGCPADGNPVFSGIFTENTVAKSNYNSLQVLFQKNFNNGLQFQASYTLSKTMDNASSFESALNPLNFDATYGLSAYDARHRFVFNYVWDLPVPKVRRLQGQASRRMGSSPELSRSRVASRFASRRRMTSKNSTRPILFEIPRRAEPHRAVPHAKHPQQQRLRFRSGSLHECDRRARHDRQCAALDLLRPRHQQHGT